MKNIANILTGSRVILALVLLFFFKDINVAFLIIFSIAEFTDIIDGTIARKTNSESTIGAILDTIADVLLASNILKMALTYEILQGGLLVWFIIIVIIAIVYILLGIIKFKKLVFNHNILSKIFGAALTIIPFGIYFDFIGNFLIVALMLFMFAMIDNILILIYSKDYDNNIKFIGSIKKNKH